MRGVVIHGPGDVRVEEREDPTIQEPTDAVIRIVAACVCGSDLWPYRGAERGPVRDFYNDQDLRSLPSLPKHTG